MNSVWGGWGVNIGMQLLPYPAHIISADASFLEISDEIESAVVHLCVVLLLCLRFHLPHCGAWPPWTKSCWRRFWTPSAVSCTRVCGPLACWKGACWACVCVLRMAAFVGYCCSAAVETLAVLPIVTKRCWRRAVCRSQHTTISRCLLQAHVDSLAVNNRATTTTTCTTTGPWCACVHRVLYYRARQSLRRIDFSYANTVGMCWLRRLVAVASLSFFMLW